MSVVSNRCLHRPTQAGSCLCPSERFRRRSRTLWVKNRQSFLAAVVDPKSKWHKGVEPLKYGVEHGMVLRCAEFDKVVDRSCLSDGE